VEKQQENYYKLKIEVLLKAKNKTKKKSLEKPIYQVLE